MSWRTRKDAHVVTPANEDPPGGERSSEDDTDMESPSEEEESASEAETGSLPIRKRETPSEQPTPLKVTMRGPLSERLTPSLGSAQHGVIGLKLHLPTIPQSNEGRDTSDTVDTKNES
jgi:hypothetical protein